MKAGDLVRLSTPDGDNGKLALIVCGDTQLATATTQTTIEAVIVGEAEIKQFLPWEVEHIKETFISK